MSIVLDILRTYRAPRAVLTRRMSGPPREDRALACLMAACGLIFVAQWPRLSREAVLDPSIALDARLAGALFAWLMVMPLVLYGLGLLVLLLARGLGRRLTGFQVRMALFWSLLATVPLWLLAGLAAGFAPGPAFPLLSTLALGLVAVFTGAGILAAPKTEEGVA